MVVVGLGFNASTAVVNTCNEQVTGSNTCNGQLDWTV